MFTEDSIRKETSEQSFSRGRQLYMGGNVQSIQVTDMYYNDQKCHRVKAFVQGSSWRCYNLNIVVDKEHGKIISHACDCPAHETGAGLCKHGVATLIRYLQVQKDQEKKLASPVKKITVEIPDRGKLTKIEESFPSPQEEKTILSMPKTDIGLYRILMGNGFEQQLKYRQAGMRHKVHVQPILHECFGKWSVEFKLGTSHMYILKNIFEFEAHMRHHEFERYGAKLEFYHHLSAFDKQSVPIVEFILKLAEDFRTRGGLSAYQFYYSNDTKRQVPLVGVNLDEFMELLGEQEFILESSLQEGVFHVSKESPKLPLIVTGVMAGIKVHTKHYEISKGSRYQYIIDADKASVYRVALEDIMPIEEFRDYMNRQSGKPAFIAEKELPVFCRDLLPQLEKHYEISFVEFRPEKYMPEPVSFKLYLDMPQQGIITCKLMAVYESGTYNVFTIQNESRFIDFAAGVVMESRDVKREVETDAFVSFYFPTFDEKNQLKYFAGTEDEIYEFLTGGIEELSEAGTVFVSESMRKYQILKSPGFSVGVSIKSNLLQIELDSPDMSMEEFTEILAGYNRKKKFFRLKNGSFVDMQDKDLQNLIATVSGLGLTKSQLKKGDFSIPGYRALYLETMLEDYKEHVQIDDSFRMLVQNMQEIHMQKYALPDGLQGIMREYQKEGFQWLETLHHNGFGGILADDMGLGKTLQVISFLLSHAAGEKKNTSLIVCPASLVYNWENEIRRFAPTLEVCPVIGDAARRKELIGLFSAYDILITSYDLLKRDVDLYEDVDFFCEIIDEAQFIKNQNTQAARAVKIIRAGTRFALTGTPMENRLSELWSIFDYLMPGFLYSYKHFREKLEMPIMDAKDANCMEQLRKMISPFVLRRLKKDVLKDLPDKMEEVIYAKLEGKQQELYTACASRLKTMLAKQTPKEFRESKIQILAELTRLRQICCNPSLLYDNFVGEAAKTQVAMNLIENAIENGHKILVFSQFTSMLELLIEEAKKQNISYYCLTGQTSKEERIEMVDAFNEDDTSVFFISLKAGGTGLNLTSADIVIHYDPWWNLAAQNQATDRTHRIGQRNVVTVYKLIAKNTIEEKILSLQDKKQELADQVLGGENMDKATFTKEELMELLNF